MISLPLPREALYTSTNSMKVLCLYMELCKHTDSPIFTIRDEKEGYESIQTLFINLTVEDPTETVFAETVFGNVPYWLKARENRTLKPYIEEWRAVADVKRKAMAYEAIIGEVKTRGRNSFSAAKYLIDEPNKDKRNPKTKQEVETTKAAARKLSEYSEDYHNIKDLLDEQKSYPN